MEQAEKNRALIEKFYTAFSKKDFRTMADCYHADIVFEDPVFGKLKAATASKMWEMLVTRSKDLSLTFSSIQANEQQGSAKWVARYTFSATGRIVTNNITASFKFKDEKILEHKDVFDLNAWFKMAFGLKGYVFSILPFLQSLFKKRAKQTLETFIARQSK